MMSSVELWFSSSSEDEDIKREELKIKRRKIRDKSNVLELPDKVFINYFRISKDAFQYLLDKIEGKLGQPIKSSSVPSIVKLAGALRFYAEGSYQRCIGDDFNVGVERSTFSRIFDKVTCAIEDDVVSELIKFPNANEQDVIKLAFYEKFGFPGVIGCVDGTHIKIALPSKNEKHLYINRKGFSSLNVMLVCDHKMRITYVDATNPGATLDSSIWNLSRLNETLSSSYDNGERNFWLLGDAGYPLKPYLVTPFRSAQDGTPEHRFNELHSKARNIIERTNRVLKSTFRCLSGATELHYKPQKAIKIVNVCCALHNLRLKYNVPYEDKIPNAELINDEDMTDVDENMDAETGLGIRESIMNSIFEE